MSDLQFQKHPNSVSSKPAAAHFASVSIERGVPIAVLSRVLGHASITTTERYAHLADNPIRDAVERAAGAIAEQI